MTNRTTLVSYSTPNYKEVYKAHLEPTLHYWDGHTRHINLPVAQSWLKATQIKPSVILQALEDDVDGVLYLDCDAEIKDKRINDIPHHNNPIARVFLNHAQWYNNTSKTIEPLTGTLYFSKAALPFVREWALMTANSSKPDGETFAEMLLKTDLPAQHLPIEWAYINSLPYGGKGYIPCPNPIVTHHQASRVKRSEYEDMRSVGQSR